MDPQRLLLLFTILLLSPLACAQSSSPAPDSRCTTNLCKPIGNIMAYCIDPTGNTPASLITWDMMYQGTNVTDGSQVVPQRLHCFCRSVGIESMLDNCYNCYIETNQQNYWKDGINKIKQRCGFSTTSDASTLKSMDEVMGIGRIPILSILLGLLAGTVGLQAL